MLSDRKDGAVVMIRLVAAVATGRSARQNGIEAMVLVCVSAKRKASM